MACGGVTRSHRAVEARTEGKLASKTWVLMPVPLASLYKLQSPEVTLILLLPDPNVALWRGAVSLFAISTASSPANENVKRQLPLTSTHQ
jgi:hypothetical protein